ncbi:MAG: hypothetical protein ABSC11_15370 [Smithella sp.]|jgi:hypothetical protein
MSDKSNLDVSRRIQEKFEFYFLSLTFIILGLSIQTSKFGSHSIPDGFELLAWIFLFVAGMAGLSRMRWSPSLYKVKHEIIRREQYRDEAKRRELSGETYIIQQEKEKPIGDFIADVSQGVEEVEEQLGDLEIKNDRKYWLHIYGFTFGLLFLMVSRGYDPALRFICTLLK